MNPSPLALDLCEAALAAPDLAGRHHAAVENLVRSALRDGGALLLTLARRAVTRLLARPHAHSGRLLTEAELLELAAALEAALRAAEDLARGLLLDHQFDLARRELGVAESYQLSAFSSQPIAEAAYQPSAALRFFRSLLAVLGRDPRRSGPTLARRAFTLAAATDTELLRKVQATIADRIQTGLVTTGARAVAAVLDAAGVSPRNPQYPEAVFRTNTLDGFNQAYQDELSRNVDLFPVWMYSNPADSRSRPEHAARNRRYYPSTVPFTVVRGTGPEDVINCRCMAIATDRATWARLEAAGARLADGYALAR